MRLLVPYLKSYRAPRPAPRHLPQTLKSKGRDHGPRIEGEAPDEEAADVGQAVQVSFLLERCVSELTASLFSFRLFSVELTSRFTNAALPRSPPCAARQRTWSSAKWTCLRAWGPSPVVYVPHHTKCPSIISTVRFTC